MNYIMHWMGLLLKNQLHMVFIIILIADKRLKEKKMIPMPYIISPYSQYIFYSNHAYFNDFCPLDHCLKQQIYTLALPNHSFGSEAQIISNQIQRPAFQSKASFGQTEMKENEEISVDRNKKNSKKGNVDQQQNKKKKEEHIIDRGQMNKDSRNANSNLLRIFFRAFQQRIQDRRFINFIIKKNKMKIDYQKFVQWLEIHKVQHRNYIRLHSVKKLFFGKKNDNNTKLMRILLKDFLQNDAHSFYLTSKKIKKSSMGHNYHSFRTILLEIQKIK